MKRTLFLVFVSLLALNTYSRAAGEYTATSCDFADVDELINGPTHTAVDGDIINIPAGTCTWDTDYIQVPDDIGITIRGAGTPSNDPSTRVPSASCASNTTITMQNSYGFAMNPLYGASLSRISCMKLIQGTAGRAFTFLGTCTSSGCPNIRVDNIHFTDSWAGSNHLANGSAVGAVTNVFGVIDHNQLDGYTPSGPPPDDAYTQFIQFFHGSYMGQGHYGDYAWNQPEDYGTEKFIYMENNTLLNAGCCENEGDAFSLNDQGGGRVVVRFNDFEILSNLNFILGYHGTETAGRPRSGRAFEMYGNDYGCHTFSCDQVAGVRGGTGLVWGNTLDISVSFNTFFTLTTFRAGGSLGDWGPCDGTGTHDENDGMTYDGPFTVASGGGTYTITVSGTPWTTNQWVSNGSPYSIHIEARGQGTEIFSNTTNTLTLSDKVSGTPWQPADGDSFTILRATKCIDQAGGLGEGDMLNDTNPATPTGWTNQVVSPVYLWSNSFPDNDTSVFCTGLQACSSTARVIRNRDFYHEEINQAAQTTSSSPFDGTTTIGMGHGIASRKPSTCTAGAGSTKGVGYFATDEGSWNTSGNGFGNGRLYLCTAADTWTLSYTPYDYPHPLISGAPAGGSPRARAIGRFR